MKFKNASLLLLRALVFLYLFLNCVSIYAFDMLAYVPRLDDRVHTGHMFSDSERREDLRHAVVKIYTAEHKPGKRYSGASHQERTINGSGCIVQGNMILTNAHVVSGQKFIQVRKSGESRKYEAHVLYMSPTSDLALLKTDDDQFFDDVQPLEIGSLPDIHQETGGDSDYGLFIH